MRPHLEVLTIGHSTHSYERFLELLRGAKITAVADVRSSPHSRRFPQFNGDELRRELKVDRISYVFLGKELGGRPDSEKFFDRGIADYERMATTADFAHGLKRIVEGAKAHRIALMCSEANPLECHRCLLVGRALFERGVAIEHILLDGRVVSQGEIEQKLLEVAGQNGADLFASFDERLASAYRTQARKVAFMEPETIIQKSAGAG